MLPLKAFGLISLAVQFYLGITALYFVILLYQSNRGLAALNLTDATHAAEQSFIWPVGVYQTFVR